MSILIWLRVGVAVIISSLPPMMKRKRMEILFLKIGDMKILRIFAIMMILTMRLKNPRSRNGHYNQTRLRIPKNLTTAAMK
jgi:hypothetical protein